MGNLSLTGGDEKEKEEAQGGPALHRKKCSGEKGQVKKLTLNEGKGGAEGVKRGPQRVGGKGMGTGRGPFGQGVGVGGEYCLGKGEKEKT